MKQLVLTLFAAGFIIPFVVPNGISSVSDPAELAVGEVASSGGTASGDTFVLDSTVGATGIAGSVEGDGVSLEAGFVAVAASLESQQGITSEPVPGVSWPALIILAAFLLGLVWARTLRHGKKSQEAELHC